MPLHDDDDLGPRAPLKRAFTPRQRPDYRIELGQGPVKPGGSWTTTFVGGLFDDPMVVLRLAHAHRALCFDLGEVAKVPTRVVHQVSDVFISHGHLDHLCDFPWLLRRRIGTTEAMRLYGPPGLARQVQAMIQAFTWDRIADRGPKFEVHEVWPDHERVFPIQVGQHVELHPLTRPRLPDLLLRDEPRLQIRTVCLDHGTPVQAYAVEESQSFGVRADRLRALGLEPGPWLGELKDLAAQRLWERDLLVQGLTHRVKGLSDELLIPKPGQKIVYATDFAYTPQNIDTLLKIAHGADVLICEASFCEADRAQAERTSHLCARDCGEIARLAEVGLLIPFHLSVRYESNTEQAYREILEVFDKVAMPAEVRAKL